MNRLAAETGPYLLQHVDNPVDWYPWGEVVGRSDMTAEWTRARDLLAPPRRL